MIEWNNLCEILVHVYSVLLHSSPGKKKVFCLLIQFIVLCEV